MTNDYVFGYRKVTVVAIRLKYGVDVHSSFVSKYGNLEVFSQFGYEGIDVYVTGGELRLVANVFRPGIEY